MLVAYVAGAGFFRVKEEISRRGEEYREVFPSHGLYMVTDTCKAG